MAIQLSNLAFVSQENHMIFPATDVVSTSDRLFIVCDNNELAEALISGINDKLSSKRALTIEDMNNIIDEMLTGGGQKLATASLAMTLISKSACLTVQMGKSRVLHVATSENEIAYDSRNHILDTYSSKARIQLINNIKNGDFVLIALSDIVDTQALLRMTDDLAPQSHHVSQADLTKLLTKHKQQAPSSYLMQFTGSSGMVNAIADRIKDINWKWMMLFLALAAAITSIAFLSLNGNISWDQWNEKDKDTVVLQSTDSTTLTDTIAAPIPMGVPEDVEVKKDTIKRIVHDAPPQETPVEETTPTPKVEEPKTKDTKAVEPQPAAPVVPSEPTPPVQEPTAETPQQ